MSKYHPGDKVIFFIFHYSIVIRATYDGVKPPFLRKKILYE